MRLLAACDAALGAAGDAAEGGAARDAELSALYGERAAAAAPAAERVDLLRVLQVRAARLVRARETLAAVSSASSPVDTAAELLSCDAPLHDVVADWTLQYASGSTEFGAAPDSQAWTPWCAAWRGLGSDPGHGASVPSL